jgi:hypothetical protein
MAKKTRTELSTLALNTNLPDNTTELITPTTERAQLTDERESVVNYKDDLGGVPNAGKFLTVAVDGESLTMVDAPTGDVTGTGTQYQLAVWDGTSALTGYAALTYINSILQAPQLRAESSNGTVTINATDASGGTAWLYFQNASVLKAEISYFIQDDFLTIRTYQKDIVFERAVNTPTLTIDGTTGDATFSGNVGINETNPQAKLHVTETTSNSYGEIRIEGQNRGGKLQMYNAAYPVSSINTDQSGNIEIQTSGAFASTTLSTKLSISSGGNVGIGTDNPSSGVGTTSTGTLLDVYDGTVIGNNGGALVLSGLGNSSRKLNLGQIRTILTNGGVGVETSDMTFSTMSAATLTERMRISSGGDISSNLINATSFDYGFTIAPQSGYSQLYFRSDSTSSRNIQRFYNQTGGVLQNVGNIIISGSTTSYATSSDYRLKENVTPITDALSRLNQLKPSRFNFIADADRTVDGFIAHEVEDIVPEAISGEKDAMRDEEFELTPRVEAVIDEDGNVITEAVEAVMETRSVPDYQGIDQSKIVPLLTAAIQEQQTIIADLITRLEALEA